MKNSSIKTFAVIAILMTMATPAYAQSTQEQAKAYFYAAEEAYDAGDYEGALRGLKKAEEISGQTGPALLKLEAKALFKLDRYQETKSVLNEFYASGPSQQSQREVSSILLAVDGKVEAERLHREQERIKEQAVIARKAAFRSINISESGLVEFLNTKRFSSFSQYVEQAASIDRYKAWGQNGDVTSLYFYTLLLKLDNKSDYEKSSRKLYAQMCDLDFIPACNSYAAILDGDLSTKGEAYRLFSKGAKSGNLLSINNQGVMLYFGSGVRQDLLRGIRLVNKACEGGLSDSCDFVQEQRASLGYRCRGSIDEVEMEKFCRLLFKNR